MRAWSGIWGQEPLLPSVPSPCVIYYQTSRARLPVSARASLSPRPAPHPSTVVSPWVAAVIPSVPASTPDSQWLKLDPAAPKAFSGRRTVPSPALPSGPPGGGSWASWTQRGPQG